MAFDVEGARKAGYSDGEIASHLGLESGFDVAAATKAGYQPSEIVGFLSVKPIKPTAETRASLGDPGGSGFSETAQPPKSNSVMEDYAAPIGGNHDPMLQPEFIENFRQELGQMPLEKRLPALQAYASTDKSVYGRAARVILADESVKNRDYFGKDIDRELARKLNAAPLYQPPGGRGKRTSADINFPEVTPDFNEMADGATAKNVAETNQTAQIIGKASVDASRDQVLRDRIAQERMAQTRIKFGEDNPITGSLASGLAGQVAGLVNAPSTAADAFNKTVVDPFLRLAGANPMPKPPEALGTKYLLAMQSEYMPAVGKKDFDDVVSTKEFGPWLVSQLAANSPQMAMQLGAAMVPVLRPAILPAMGAQTAGQNFLQGDDSRVAIAKGFIEIGTEMLPLGVFDKVKAAIEAVPRGARRAVLAETGKRLALAGGAITASTMTEAVEEVISQVSGNLLDKHLQGKDVEWNKGAAGAAIVGGLSGTVMSAPHLAQIAKDNTPQGRLERALAEQLNSGEFSKSATPDSSSGPTAKDMIARHWGEPFAQAAAPVAPVIAGIAQAKTVDEAVAAAQRAVAPSVQAVDNIERLLATSASGRLQAASPLENPDVRNDVAADATIQPSAGERSAVDARGVDAGRLLDTGAGRDERIAAEPVARSAEDGVLGDGRREQGAVAPDATAEVAMKKGPGGIQEPTKVDLLMKDGTPFEMVRQWTGNYHLIADGKKIGQLTYTTSLPGEFKASGVMVDPAFRRKGVATAAYDFIEQNIIGKPFDRAGGQSADGAAFRGNRTAKQGNAAEAAVESPVLPRLKDADLAGKSFDELDAMHGKAGEHNRKVDLEAIAKFWSPEQAKNAEGWSTRRREKWLSDNETDETSKWTQDRYINDELIKSHRDAVNDFDVESPEALGRSIAVRAKDVDKPGFFTTPEGTGFSNALRHAKSEGWDLNKVMDGMRGRSAEWAGSDAPELFSRLFKKATGESADLEASTKPSQVEAAPDSQRAMVELRKRKSVLESLINCLG